MVRIEHEDTISGAFLLLIQTAQAVLKYTDTYLYRKAGVSAVKFKVLDALYRHDGVMMPSRIAEWTQTERQNITTLIGRMRQEGLITTESNANDKRTVNIILTDKGREVLSRVLPMTKLVVNQLMSAITQSDAALLEKTLGVLRQNANHGLQGLVKHSRPSASGNGKSTID